MRGAVSWTYSFRFAQPGTNLGGVGEEVNKGLCSVEMRASVVFLLEDIKALVLNKHALRLSGAQATTKSTEKNIISLQSIHLTIIQ